jgi:hypothetical protein
MWVIVSFDVRTKRAEVLAVNLIPVDSVIIIAIIPDAIVLCRIKKHLHSVLLA